MVIESETTLALLTGSFGVLVYLCLLGCWFRKWICLICFVVLAVILYIVCGHYYDPNGFKEWFSYTCEFTGMQVVVYAILRFFGVKLP